MSTDNSLGGHIWKMPDLWIEVQKINLNGEILLDYELSGQKLGGPSLKVGSVPVGQEYRKHLNEVLAQWQAMSQERGSWPKELYDDQSFREKGARLYNILLPEQLRRKLWALRHSAQTLIFCCKEEIPWEILFLQDPDSNQSEQFLGMCFHVARWLPQDVLETKYNEPINLHFNMEPMALLTGDSQRLTCTKGEMEDFIQNYQQWSPKRIDSNLDSVRRALESGRYGSWHFVGHGVRSEGEHQDIRLILASAEELTPDVLSYHGKKAGKRRPFVFWNCCHSARKSQFFGLRGWPDIFLKYGFGAFVGTMWAVDDAAAAVFAKTFYQCFASGETLGAAMTAGRTAVREIGSSDALAYVLYGDPRATIRSRDVVRSPESLVKTLVDSTQWQQVHKPFLETVGVVQEQVSAGFLSQASGVSLNDTQAAIKFWRDHLRSEGKKAPIYRPGSELRQSIHALEEQGILDLRAGHKRMVQVLMEQIYGATVFGKV